jgi:hypothetical protein
VKRRNVKAKGFQKNAADHHNKDSRQKRQGKMLVGTQKQEG